MSNCRSTLLFYGIALAWLAIDQWTKYEVLQRLAFGESVPAIPGYLAWTHVTNTGGAWSVFAGNPVPLGIVSAIVCLALLVYERRSLPRPALQTAAWALVLGGALGNMIDRFRLQHVVDMIDLQWQGQNVFPIFNVADIGINLGVGLMLVLSFVTKDEPAPQTAEEAAS